MTKTPNNVPDQNPNDPNKNNPVSPAKQPGDAGRHPLNDDSEATDAAKNHAGQKK